MVDSGEDDVEHPDVENKECLASRRNDSQAEESRHSVTLAEDGRVDDVGVEFTPRVNMVRRAS